MMDLARFHGWGFLRHLFISLTSKHTDGSFSSDLHPTRKKILFQPCQRFSETNTNLLLYVAKELLDSGAGYVVDDEDDESDKEEE